ncbi:MAG: asparagine synthase (glutamine-hydrolyzing) [Proteobacteria bacterium]|nr:asparagine synthase (glutamine-hydrolyzing) [Pseudomonadota bacterium]MBU1741422.1 asparagine synthase (glutamine-hydrolyzing) [Pseudomonadota bacterium]
MCGILVYLGPTALAVDHPALQSVAHRGPDDAGAESFTVREGRLTLGHRRLSILDLSPAGRQPMSDPEGRYWIVYNGEVYNYLELRQELQRAGHRFVSGTDTEVVLAAYAAWGEACLERFNGMFALAIYDARDRTLFLARDRFGIKPLYTWNSPRGLAAVSEIKQLSSLPGFEAALDPEAAYEFVAYDDWNHTPRTFFAGVERFPAGHALRLDLNRWRPGRPVTPRRWYDLGRVGRMRREDPRAVIERFGELLRDSVRLRLRADVPVGFCLSGGLDSSSLVVLADRLARERGGGDLNTFSVRFDDPRFDEGPFIDAVCAAARVRPHGVRPQPGRMLTEIDDVVYHQDQPLSTTSLYAQWNVFRLARENQVPVTLDGQGADEVLAGYHSYFGPRLLSLALALNLGGLRREIRGLSNRHGDDALTIAKMILVCLLPHRFSGPGRWTRQARQGHEVLRPEWLAAHGVRRRGPHPMRRQRSVRKMTVSRLTRTLPALLHNADRMSMAHSVEARLPYLDWRVVEYGLAAADDHKIKAGETKLLLRQAMRDLLPEKVRTRTDKLTFQPPEGEWIRRQIPDDFRDLLQEALHLPLFDRRSVLRRFDEFLDGRTAYDRVFWRIMTFGRWQRRFGVALP